MPEASSAMRFVAASHFAVAAVMRDANSSNNFWILTGAVPSLGGGGKASMAASSGWSPPEHNPNAKTAMSASAPQPIIVFLFCFLRSAISSDESWCWQCGQRRASTAIGSLHCGHGSSFHLAFFGMGSPLLQGQLVRSLAGNSPHLHTRRAIQITRPMTCISPSCAVIGVTAGLSLLIWAAPSGRMRTRLIMPRSP